MECAQQETPTATETATEMEGVKLPKNTKGIKYYYRHREEILEKKRQQRLEDPEYLAKQQAKEDAKKAKEEERIRKLQEKEEQRKLKEENKEREKEEKRRERAKKKAELLGIQPLVPSGLK